MRTDIGQLSASLELPFQKEWEDTASVSVKETKREALGATKNRKLSRFRTNTALGLCAYDLSDKNALSVQTTRASCVLSTLLVPPHIATDEIDEILHVSVFLLSVPVGWGRSPHASVARTPKTRPFCGRLPSDATHMCAPLPFPFLCVSMHIGAGARSPPPDSLSPLLRWCCQTCRRNSNSTLTPLPFQHLRFVAEALPRAPPSTCFRLILCSPQNPRALRVSSRGRPLSSAFCLRFGSYIYPS